MTYEQINNIFLLISTGAVAYLFYLIFQYAYEVSDRLPSRNRKDELKEKRIRKLKLSAFEYYYSMAINNPSLLATELAENHVNELNKQGLINKTYSQLKAI